MEKCFFFFPKNWKKKNKRFLFFPRNSLWATHSKIFETLYFYIGKSCLACFFFSGHFWHDFCFFFFPRKSLPSLTHSVEKRVFFFPAAGKKKKRVFHTLTRFLPKNPKKQTIPGKKKKRYLCCHLPNYFPPGSKSVALQLGVHLILLYFIRIWSWVRRLFFYFGGWQTTFWFFKSLDINLVYTYMYIFSYSHNFRTILVGLILSSSWTFFYLFSKSIC